MAEQTDLVDMQSVVFVVSRQIKRGKEMTKPKYQKLKQVETLSQFDNSGCKWYKVNLGGRWHTFHRSMLLSQQVIVLKRWIIEGKVWETNEVE